MHTPEPLLARRVPEICNENTALTACGWLLGRALGITHMGGGHRQNGHHTAATWVLHLDVPRQLCVHLRAWVGERDARVRRKENTDRKPQEGGGWCPPALNPQDAGPATVKTRPTSQMWKLQHARPGPGKAVTSRTAKLFLEGSTLFLPTSY